MRRLALCAFLILSAGPAFAEVCDKVRPNWNPSNGRVNQLQELYYFFSGPLGVSVIALFFLAFLIKRTWLSFLVSLVLVFIAGLIVENWFWPEDGVTRGAHFEGCIANPLITSLVVIVLGVLAAIFGKTRKS